MPREASVVAVSEVGAPGTAIAVVTFTVALPETLPTAAMTVPLPVVVELAVKVVDDPVRGLTLPGVPLLPLQAAVATLTGFANASAPVAENTRVLPSATVALVGDTTIVASGPEPTVSVCVPAT